MHEVDWITVAYLFDWIRSPFTNRLHFGRQASLPVLGALTNGVLYRRPEFCWSGVNCSVDLTISMRASVKAPMSALLKRSAAPEHEQLEPS
jgi:hypothetical protein